MIRDYKNVRYIQPRYKSREPGRFVMMLIWCSIAIGCTGWVTLIAYSIGYAVGKLSGGG